MRQAGGVTLDDERVEWARWERTDGEGQWRVMVEEMGNDWVGVRGVWWGLCSKHEDQVGVTLRLHGRAASSRRQTDKQLV